MSTVLFREVEVDGAVTDVRVENGVVSAVGPNLPASTESELVEGAGGALLPGLHDHHLHLLALAAHLVSADVAGVTGLEGLAAALRNAPHVRGWIRAIGYHESIAGDLDRGVLDRLVPDRPVRVQHRSGALWMLNSAALERIAGVLDQTTDVERDGSGTPTGRLWRYDARLRPALPAADLDLAALGRVLAGHGITSVTDATPDLPSSALSLLAAGQATGDLPQRVMLLGAPNGSDVPSAFTIGPRKLLLRDHDLPSYDQLAAMVAQAHTEGRGVAVHCVTRHSLVLTLAVLEDVGVHPTDRIEHASVVPLDVAEWLSRLGVQVVTQPDFLRTRGAQYETEVDASDRPHLYRYASLLARGIPTCASSDAPYGDLDPWQVMATAADRPLGPEENVGTAIALDGYLSSPHLPGGAPRRLRPGVDADLVLLHAPLRTALREPRTELVRSCWINGSVIRPSPGEQTP